MNIEDYTEDNLYKIFNITRDTSEFEINKVTNLLISKMKNKQDDDTANFLVQARDKLLMCL